MIAVGGVSLWLGWVGKVLSRSHGRNRERVVRSAHGHASPDSKAKGTHPQSDRTAHPHIEPPSCNYSRCRSAPHIPTNRLRAYFRVPVCAHNCARWRSTPSASPQPRTTRLRASGIIAWHPQRIYDSYQGAKTRYWYGRRLHGSRKRATTSDDAPAHHHMNTSPRRLSLTRTTQ
ncbi:hypothetical protein SNOG_20068 [Parastagonospora nodorum SN15]|uniref:Uncharacterized protein n=1 Tax=Phaeosphaeria nodorum (strain SN15 / ATCC MYA-4574 / FGSC 10173) TaxID=321614 RepID=A9JX65_PHANO|nr:hypothetical protein SNOG_20068 [Parastagonospora nodorum SN15]EDP89924.1 hypothetical protein SNOG_20068 [Parastagonospora nodorum SN15]